MIRRCCTIGSIVLVVFIGIGIGVRRMLLCGIGTILSLAFFIFGRLLRIRSDSLDTDDDDNDAEDDKNHRTDED